MQSIHGKVFIVHTVSYDWGGMMIHNAIITMSFVSGGKDVHDLTAILF